MLHSVAESMCHQVIRELEQQRLKLNNVGITLSGIQRLASSEETRHRAQREQFKVRRALNSVDRALEAAQEFDTDTLVLWTMDLNEHVRALDPDLLKAA